MNTVIPLARVRQLHRRHPHMRISRLVDVMEREHNQSRIQFELMMEPILRRMSRELDAADHPSEFTRIFGREAS